jgi:hypothetical protein
MSDTSPPTLDSPAMNAVEIEEAISTLAEQSFDAEEFPFSFLEAFGEQGNHPFASG